MSNEPAPTPYETEKKLAYELSWLKRSAARAERLQADLKAAQDTRNGMIRRAREAGASWTAVAAATGMSDQGARKASPDPISHDRAMLELAHKLNAATT